jgi:hypothetical protein
MTAPIGTARNVFTGLRELSQVTNTYAGYLQSAGAAYNLVLPWQADKLEWYNYTKYATNSNNLSGVWFRDFPAGDALIIARGTTTLTSTLEATNGVTIANTTGGFANEHLVISGITTATPGVVTTTTNHNLTDLDRVVITKVIGTAAAELNNNTYVVDVLSATTFALYDTFGVPVTVVGTYTSSGQVTKIAPLLGQVSSQSNYPIPQNSIQDYPIQYRLTLGSAVMGADNDVIYFVATKFNAYFNLGDVA